ncbi:hypothetical protein L0337_02955 [candidate division KSB1 bacterium]|nr:hypothetical protein [candidate division KSB1 bacterium]
MRFAVYKFEKETARDGGDNAEQPNSEEFQWVTVSKSPCHIASRRQGGVAKWLHFCEFRTLFDRFKTSRLCYAETAILQKCTYAQKHLNYTGNGFELRKKNFLPRQLLFLPNAGFKGLAHLSK